MSTSHRQELRPEFRHPALLAVAEKRAADRQLRLADAITAFAGSMKFVYLHVAIFVVWMLVLEKNPWPTLTLAVSLEAIFLSTFVMIGQNRQAQIQQAKADHDSPTTSRSCTRIRISPGRSIGSPRRFMRRWSHHPRAERRATTVCTGRRIDRAESRR